MRDPSKFREHFKAYKEGKSVREIYGLPGYAEGTVGDDPKLALILKYEGWRDTAYLDSKGIPTIGWGFTNPTLVKKKKITRAEGDAELRRLNKLAEVYVRKLLGADIWDQLDDKTKGAFLSYYHNYPAGFKDTTKMIRYWRAGNYDAAVKEIDAGINDPSSPGLRPRRLEELATIRKDPFLFPKVTYEKPADITINRADVTRVAPIQTAELQAIDYKDRRNTFRAEAERAMWAHTAFENMPKVSDMPIWKSSSLPALEEQIELDVTPMKTYAGGKLPGYQEGYIRQGKTRPIVHAADRLRRKPGDGVVIGTVKDGLSNALYDIDKSFQSLRNIENFGGTGWDWFNVALGSTFSTEGYIVNKTAKDAIKAAKTAIKNASKKTINPTKASVKKNLNPSNLGRYYTEHPEEITPIKDSKELKKAVDFVNQHVAPAYAKQNKVLIGLKPEDINLGYADFGGVDLAAYTGPNNQVVLNKKIINNSKYVDDVLGHEVGGHIVDQNWPITPSQMSEVQLAIPFDQLFIADNKFFPKGAEANAMRRLFLKLISEDNGNIVGSELNKFYKNMPRALKQRYWSLVGYNDKTNINWDDLSLFDKVMTSIPAAGTFAIPTTYIGIDPNEKLLSYKDGKISINPANRGKFNATKKRTGKTTEELTHSKNPLTRKRAIFALNAKKWNHK